MDQNKADQQDEFAVGDQVGVKEMKASGAEMVTATIVETRHILGRQTYVIETGDGKRRVVGASQISRLEE